VHYPVHNGMAEARSPLGTVYEEAAISDTKSEVSITRIAVASAIGRAIEWYDFFLYGVVSAIIFNRLFVFGFRALCQHRADMGNLRRRLSGEPGGVGVVGHFGDRIGRKTILILTLVIMGAGTFAVGLLPTYQ
jgi:MFS transporter, MHS family, shikimate and dehydroshikimate transport protein